jgi:hypothetical protein
MEINVGGVEDLISAIHRANGSPDDSCTIHLKGEDFDYVVHDAQHDLFGLNAFPLIMSDITINGNGRLIQRNERVKPFRFFAVLDVPAAKLTLNKLTLSGGNSGGMGGGAIVNNALLHVHRCMFQNNTGSHGGAIYNGDARNAVFEDCRFQNNVASIEGGAIYNSTLASLIVTKTAFTGNKVGEGKKADVYVSGPYYRPVVIHSTTLENGVALIDDLLPLTGGDALIVDSDEG